MSGEHHIIQIYLCEITGTQTYFRFRSLNVVPGEYCVCCITVSIMEMTMWIRPHSHVLNANVTLIETSLCLCKYWESLVVHTQYFEHFMRNRVPKSKWLIDICTLMSKFYFSQCCVLWVIFSFTMIILEINFKLEVNGLVIELHILYLHTYYHCNQHNIPECL